MRNHERTFVELDRRNIEMTEIDYINNTTISSLEPISTKQTILNKKVRTDNIIDAINEEDSTSSGSSLSSNDNTSFTYKIQKCPLHDQDGYGISCGNIDQGRLQSSFQLDGRQWTFPEEVYINKLQRNSVCISKESQTDKISQNFKFDDFENLLPVEIDGVYIKKLTWDDFKSKPDQDSEWKAHAYWQVGYSYEIKNNRMRNNSRSYKGVNRLRINFNVWTNLNECSWVKIRIPRLLEHETGHYLLGCLCALEFKFRASKQRFNWNYRQEIENLFQEVYQQYIQMEKIYDTETDHSRNIKEQKKWNTNIIRQLSSHLERVRSSNFYDY